MNQKALIAALELAIACGDVERIARIKLYLAKLK